MSRFWSPVVGTLSPYVPGEQPKLQNLVKLNTNEHPYGPSPKVLEAIRAASDDTLKLYPDPSSDQLRQAIAATVGVQANQVFVGNGSDEVLAHAFLALLKHDKPLRFPDITYSFYPVYCGLYGIQYETVPLAADFSINVDDYLPSANGQAGAIIFPNPNAPTGRAMSLADVERESAVGLVARYDNLLVVQTLSKSRSLAGLRVGFAVGSAELIDGLERVKNSFNSYPIDRLASAGAVAALEDTEYFEQTRQAVIETRSRMTAGLEALGFEVLPSAANFVFARHPLKDAAGLAAALRERSIIVRHFRQARIDQFLRITVGTDEQVNLLLKALAEVLQT
jgi:histidinol-phosphate aminotransferase